MMRSLPPDDADYGSARTHRQAAFFVVGGSLVVAMTAFGVLGRFNTFFADDTEGGGEEGNVSKSVWREHRSGSILPLPLTASPTHRPSIKPSASHVPSLMPSVTLAPSEHPSSTPTASGKPSLTASDFPSVSGEPTRTPSSYPSIRPSILPTRPPSFPPTTSIQPTGLPTASPTAPPSKAPTTGLLMFSASSTGAFHLRLHWQPGYSWQESTDEMWFCMACAWCDANIFDEHCSIKTYCEENMSIALYNCDPSKRRNSNPRRRDRHWMAKFNVLSGPTGSGLFEDPEESLQGDQIQVYGSTLCLERVGGGRSILLQQCNATVQEQRFIGFRSDGQPMELVPYPGTFLKDGVSLERCLTQHHHPRQGERVFAEVCTRARNSQTNLWATY